MTKGKYGFHGVTTRRKQDYKKLDKLVTRWYTRRQNSSWGKTPQAKEIRSRARFCCEKYHLSVKSIQWWYMSWHTDKPWKGARPRSASPVFPF